jgi:hypothetical protein
MLSRLEKAVHCFFMTARQCPQSLRFPQGMNQSLTARAALNFLLKVFSIPACFAKNHARRRRQVTKRRD